MAMSAKDQMSKMLDQLMGQNRDGEWRLFLARNRKLEFWGVHFLLATCLSFARGRPEL